MWTVHVNKRPNKNNSNRSRRNFIWRQRDAPMGKLRDNLNEKRVILRVNMWRLILR